MTIIEEKILPGKFLQNELVTVSGDRIRLAWLIVDAHEGTTGIRLTLRRGKNTRVVPEYSCERVA